MIFAGGFSDFEKAEQREREKRHRERLKSIELQREKLHRAACEEAAAKFMELAAQPGMPPMPPVAKQTTPKHRHSVHSSTNNHLHITAEDLEKLRIHSKGGKTSGPQRSTSSEHCRGSVDHGKSNKFLRWLGLAGKDDQEKEEEKLFKELKKRRMSTFT